MEEIDVLQQGSIKKHLQFSKENDCRMHRELFANTDFFAQQDPFILFTNYPKKYRMQLC